MTGSSFPVQGALAPAGSWLLSLAVLGTELGWGLTRDTHRQPPPIGLGGLAGITVGIERRGR